MIPMPASFTWGKNSGCIGKEFGEAKSACTAWFILKEKPIWLRLPPGSQEFIENTMTISMFEAAFKRLKLEILIIIFQGLQK